MSVGTPLSQHAFSRSYKRNCKPGTTRLYSFRDSFFFKLIFSSMAEGQFYSGMSAFAAGQMKRAHEKLAKNFGGNPNLVSALRVKRPRGPDL
jgi:hypothetical protein